MFKLTACRLPVDRLRRIFCSNRFLSHRILAGSPLICVYSSCDRSLLKSVRAGRVCGGKLLASLFVLLLQNDLLSIILLEGNRASVEVNLSEILIALRTVITYESGGSLI